MITPARPLTAAGALFTDGDGRVLLVEPTYKPEWEIPGGVVEGSETPAEGCAREVREELGLEIVPGRLLVVDWAPWQSDARVLFVFDGGTLPPTTSFRLQPEEIRSARFAAPAEVTHRCLPRLSRRVHAALAAWERGETRYLENGTAV
ncbi:NUDIX domain-containing protein [Actinokineospora guangxiensis]|uniref:NUDIX domain-containing protein n=1 Tax=Actinokineospora guangxiensis TaxID=1490288 RepID=A0ABW0EIN2_9PSEU